jgi:methyl-accepting chemotaxis protein
MTLASSLLGTSVPAPVSAGNFYAFRVRVSKRVGLVGLILTLVAAPALILSTLTIVGLGQMNGAFRHEMADRAALDAKIGAVRHQVQLAEEIAVHLLSGTGNLEESHINSILNKDAAAAARTNLARADLEKTAKALTQTIPALNQALLDSGLSKVPGTTAQALAAAQAQMVAQESAVEAAFDAFDHLNTDTAALVAKGDFAAAMAYLTAQEMPKLHAFNEAMDQNVVLIGKISDAVDQLDQQLVAAMNTQAAANNARIALIADIAALTLVALVLVGALFLTQRYVARPMRCSVSTLQRLADGDLDVTIAYDDRADEIGAIAKGLKTFRDNALERRRLAAAQEAERQAREKRALVVEDLIRCFDANVATALVQVNASAEQLDATARDMTRIAEVTLQQSQISAAAAQQANGNVQAVASATEELASSIMEIGRQAGNSSAIANEAAIEAARTNETVRGLSEAAQKVGDIVHLIAEIAAQTNLLALNATIEAARAGDAGKGFAVVASEVKNLATQTAKATEDISSQIAAIQEATHQSVGAIQGIAHTIETVQQIASSIAAAVEEQSAATAEIARNVQQAAMGAGEVSQAVVHVREAASQSGACSSQVLGAAGHLGSSAKHLREEVQAFFKDIRAA